MVAEEDLDAVGAPVGERIEAIVYMADQKRIIRGYANTSSVQTGYESSVR